MCQVSSCSVSADTVNSSSIPDAYSNSNEVEDFTQVSVLSLFEIVTPGGLDVSCEVSLKLIRVCS